MIWLILGFSILVGVGCLICWVWYKREKDREQADCQVLGKVVGYRYGSGTMLPKVEYRVGQKTYYRSLEYEAVVTVSTPFSSTQAESQDNPLDKVITIRRNSLYSFNGLMKHHFPEGSLLTVYYCSHCPKRSYVERYAGTKRMAFWNMCFVLTIYFYIIGIVFLVHFFPWLEYWIFLVILPGNLLILGFYFYQMLFKPIRDAKKGKLTKS